MIEALGKWIVTICIAVFFATAVQMILPDNSIKKYCNFILGLIVFVVMITPIVNFFNKDIAIDKLIEQSAQEVFGENSQTNYEEYRDSNMNSTLKVFKENLQRLCEEDLSREFKGDEFKVTANVSYDTEIQNFIINSMEIGVNDGSVKIVEEVVIGEEKVVSAKDQEQQLSEYETKVQGYISSNYDIDANKVFIYSQEK